MSFEEQPEMQMAFNVDPNDLGVELKQKWNPAFVVFAYLICLFTAYAALHLLDHGLWFWRSKELKKKAMIKHPDIYAACLLAVGSVWCMHFVGMSAVELEGTPICYNWGITIGSLAAVLVCMIAGVKVAGNDVFADPDRDDILKEILHSRYTNLDQEDNSSRYKFRVAATYKLHFVALGSFLAASGAIIMHYTGMMAQRGPFRKEWSAGYISMSVTTGIVICFVGFWIMFRLRWNIQQVWLRYASAAVIALAVCGLHFFGMISVTYYADPNSTQVCSVSKSDPNSWTSHQMVVIAIAVAILAVTFLVESAINQELLIAYEAAAKSSDIVSSLFPAQVRDRLLAEAPKHKYKVSKKSSRASDDESVSESDAAADMVDAGNIKAIIAEHYDETSILFADLAGFTEWSSTREPGQVFLLLETLYQAFDCLAARRKVFKIETIGDCYVAATGLPNPQPDHAVILTKFARDCQGRMNQILSGNLIDLLGEETKNIGFRVGMHSGPIVGGVLRGQKARFQLFGDTMNTASRMESNGVKGRIHVSEATANALIAQGKSDWLTPREEKLEVKGKGMMQTYFVNVADSMTKSMASGSSGYTGTNSSDLDKPTPGVSTAVDLNDSLPV